ncbi:MAG: T9SS type A sorting domain-containing protein [Saprospiraceae bacterium]|nr:T9SS type A sorting domain-containing protein [Saprospiraceae bacterium]
MILEIISETALSRFLNGSLEGVKNAITEGWDGGTSELYVPPGHVLIGMNYAEGNLPYSSAVQFKYAPLSTTQELASLPVIENCSGPLTLDIVGARTYTCADNGTIPSVQITVKDANNNSSPSCMINLPVTNNFTTGIYTTAGATNTTNTQFSDQWQAFNLSNPINDLDSILVDISWPLNPPRPSVTVRLYAGIGIGSTPIEQVNLPAGFGNFIDEINPAREVIPFIQNASLSAGNYTLRISSDDGKFFNWLSRNFQTGDLQSDNNWNGVWTRLITAYGNSSCPANFAPEPIVENRIIKSKTDVGDFTLTMYPNPAQNEVIILLKGMDKDAKLSIFDIQGRKLYTRNVDAGTQRLNLDISGDEYYNGVYMMMIDKAGERLFEKLVINR